MPEDSETKKQRKNSPKSGRGLLNLQHYLNHLVTVLTFVWPIGFIITPFMPSTKSGSFFPSAEILLVSLILLILMLCMFLISLASILTPLAQLTLSWLFQEKMKEAQEPGELASLRRRSAINFLVAITVVFLGYMLVQNYPDVLFK